MLKLSSVTLARNFRLSIKYPALISYNKLPWEIINHQSTALHMHLAPHYEQLLSLAATTPVPHLAAKAHPIVNEAQQLHVLPGMVYLLPGKLILPTGFTSHDVTDPTAMQYYGPLSYTIAPISRIRMLTSEDLRLLCLAVTFEAPLVSTMPQSTLEAVGTREGGRFTLYHHFRPNRPISELTRPLEKYFQHRPHVAMLMPFAEDNSQWEPRLNAPRRTKKLTPAVAYRPPESYLMGLAERLAVIPGSSFGRRSLMWGHWF